jgi:hypothetical protein
VPYTIPVHYGGPKIRITPKRTFPDVFAAGFETALRNSLAAMSRYGDDPFLLGVFIDNELPWESWGKSGANLPRTILAAEEPSLSKKALVGFLLGRHGGIAELNAAWGTGFADVEAFSEPFELDAETTERAGEDLDACVVLLAERYFSTCRRLMDEMLPGVLYLGPRFSTHRPDVVRAATEVCDAVCFNIYAEQPDEGGRFALAREQDFPLLIGEFHFGALDRGMFHTGLRGAADQEERARKFADYLATAVREPHCVGAHWFQFRDQALTGRPDGENYNIGFVSVTDTPYPEMRAAARRVNGSLYETRAEACGIAGEGN